jgi:hypothetical protein
MINASLMINDEEEMMFDQEMRRLVERRRDWSNAYLSTKADPK